MPEDLSYLSALYYTAAALFVLTAVFAAVSGSWRLALIWFILGSVLFSYRVRSGRKQK